MDSFTGHNQAAYGYNSPSAQNTSTTQVEQLSVEEIPQQDLAELLGVTPDVNLSEEGSCCSVESESDLAQQKQRNVHLIQASVSQHLPKPPSDLDQNLQQHLFSVQETVRNELMRLSPSLEKMGLIGCLIECYHCQTLDHISDLFKKVQSSQKSFDLMKWVLVPYLRYVRHLCMFCISPHACLYSAFNLNSSTHLWSFLTESCTAAVHIIFTKSFHRQTDRDWQYQLH